MERVHPAQRKALVGGIEPTKRDLRVLGVLAQNRCAWTDDLFYIVRRGTERYRDQVQRDGTTKEVASTPYKKFSERLRALFDHGFLDRLQVPGSWLSTGGRKPQAWALADAGAEALIAAGYPGLVPKKAPDAWRKANRELVKSATNGHYYIRHELRATGVLATLTRILPVESFFWFGEGEWRKFAGDPKERVNWNGQTVTQGVYPDRGFYVDFEDDEQMQRRFFLVEVDNATEPGIRKNLRGGSSLFRKYLAYRAFWKRGGHRKLDLPGFVVLTITTSQERAENLCEHARTVDARGGSHMFWSTSFDQFEDDPRAFLSPIFRSAGDPAGSEVRHSLLEPSHQTRSGSSRPPLRVVR